MEYHVEIIEESAGILQEYARIPISFEVCAMFDVQLLDGGQLTERPVDTPWVKDYDAYAGEGPQRWVDHWDISNWGILSAFEKGFRIGGCAIACNTPGVMMLEGRKELAVLWDIRVAPQYRGKGIGGRLIESSIAWAQRHGCRQIKAETQNINVPACRLYARHGFKLNCINRHAYPELPDEIQLIWRKEL